MMIEAAVRATPRLADVNSAISRSSFQLPVLVAIFNKGSEDQIGHIFAAARDVFVDIFSFKIDRLRERLSVDTVEKLVPPAVHMGDSLDTEYVLIVRAKAIFWFSGKASRRAAARLLLLEHARKLAQDEQAPFYMLRTRASAIRFAVIALVVAAIAAVALLAAVLSTRWAVILQGAASPTRSADVSTDVDARHVARGAKRATSATDARKPVADFTVPAGGWSDTGAFGKSPAERDDIP